MYPCIAIAIACFGHITYSWDNSVLVYIFSHASHHGVGLARTSLTISKDADIVSVCVHVRMCLCVPVCVTTLNLN